MRRSDNFNGPKPPGCAAVRVESCKDAMPVFDRLPRELRQFLNDAPIHLSVLTLKEHYDLYRRQYKMTRRQAIRLIQKQGEQAFPGYTPI